MSARRQDRLREMLDKAKYTGLALPTATELTKIDVSSDFADAVLTFIVLCSFLRFL